jgi:hypothetical protein
MQVRMTIALTNGDEFSFLRDKKPPHWKSWLMQRVPYGTDFQGATYAIKAVKR